MKVLIIKTSSMGDIIHTLPAMTDAQRQIPGIQFDWVVEEAFQEIPGWHESVNRIIPVAIRRWRKSLVKTWQSGEWKAFKKEIQKDQYDYVIDAQGLVKSAFLVKYCRTKKTGECYGLDKNSAREPFSTLFYKKKVSVPKGLHAVERVRILFARILNYNIDNLSLKYGIRNEFEQDQSPVNQLLFFHSTTWPTKHWPEKYWQKLINQATEAGNNVNLAWGNQDELERCERLHSSAKNKDRINILNQLSLTELAAQLRNTKAVVAVDTGLAHLAAAMDVPTITLFGPTDPMLTGPKGKKQIHMMVDRDCSPCLKKRCFKEPKSKVYPPCYKDIPPDVVWKKLKKLISKGK